MSRFFFLKFSSMRSTGIAEEQTQNALTLRERRHCKHRDPDEREHRESQSAPFEIP